MHPILWDYFNTLREVYGEIQKVIQELPPEALDWVPGEETNPLGVLAVHVAGATRYWIGDVVGQDPSGRDRDAEFRTRGAGPPALNARLDQALDHSEEVLERLAVADLETTRVSPRDGRQLTVALCLAHALEHAAVHLGHMQLTRQMWEQKASPRS